MQMDLKNHVMEETLEHFRSALSKDFDMYRNHAYRVFLHCLVLDPNKKNESLYALAAVLHDIGIWTSNTIDYLDPSARQAADYLAEKGMASLSAAVMAMIHWHHKISVYHGPREILVETFRKADWIDVTLGMYSFGTDRKTIRSTFRAFPTLGFHAFLVKKLLRHFVQHPGNPLPMFKR